MPSAGWTRIIIGLAALSAILIVWATTGDVDLTYPRAFVTGSGLVILFVLAFDRWIWRWPVFRSVTSRPDIQGTWKSELRTTWPGRRDEVIECYMVVRQTYSEVSVGMLFDRSRSYSLASDLSLENGGCVLFFVFHTQAGALHRNGNPPGRGAAALTVASEPKLHIEGDYWTERETRGTVRTVGRARRIYETFEAARAAQYS